MVEQLARQLAEELINSEYGKAFSVAKKAYDEDMQNNFQDKLGTGNVTDEEKDKFYDDINKLNNAIRNHGTSGALYKAESDFNEYTQSIMNIIMTCIQNALTPENAGCSGGCSTCSGCH